MDSNCNPIMPCSGDTDANVPVTYTRYAINKLKLSVETAWRPWYSENEVGLQLLLLISKCDGLSL